MSTLVERRKEGGKERYEEGKETGRKEGRNEMASLVYSAKQSPGRPHS